MRKKVFNKFLQRYNPRHKSTVWKFYTTWTLILVILVSMITALGYKTPRGIWRGAFSLFVGAAITGIIFMWVYHKAIAKRYFSNVKHARYIIATLDIIFHIIPLALVIWSIPWMRKHCDKVNQWTTLTMILIVLITSMLYLSIFGTSLYPAPAKVLIPIAVCTTIAAMIFITL